MSQIVPKQPLLYLNGFTTPAGVCDGDDNVLRFTSADNRHVNPLSMLHSPCLQRNLHPLSGARVQEGSSSEVSLQLADHFVDRAHLTEAALPHE